MKDFANLIKPNSSLLQSQGFVEGMKEFFPAQYVQSKDVSKTIYAYVPMENNKDSSECLTRDCTNKKKNGSSFCQICIRRQKIDDKLFKKLKEQEQKEKAKEKGNVKSSRKMTADDRKKYVNMKKERSQVMSLYKSAVTSVLLFASILPENVRSMSEILDLLNDPENNSEICETAKNIGIHKRMIEFFTEFKACSVQIDNILFILQKVMDDSDSVGEKTSAIINSFDRISPTEYPSSPKVAKLLNDEIWNEDTKSVVKKFKHSLGVIDPACKSGAILHDFYTRGIAAGMSHAQMKNKMFSIPTSSATYELLKFVYRELDWNQDCIIWKDDSTCREVNDAVVAKINGYSHSTNYANEEWEKSLENIVENEKFAFAVSNPPYQSEANRPIFQHFQNSALEMADKTSMIYMASRWWYGTSGLGAFREKMLNLKRLQDVKIFNFRETSQDLFKGTEIAGGVCIVVCSEDDNDHFTLTQNSNSMSVKMEHSSKVYPLEASFIKIAKKIQEQNAKNGLSLLRDAEGTFVINESGMTATQAGRIVIREISSVDDLLDGEIAYYGTIGGTTGELSKLYAVPDVGKYGSHNGEHRVYFRRTIVNSGGERSWYTFQLDKNTMAGAASVRLASFKNKEESDIFLKYSKTKFFEFCMRLTIASKAKCIGYFVPDLKDYTKNNPIFQSDEVLGSGHEYFGLTLDERLYTLFDLTEDEITLLEKNVWENIQTERSLLKKLRESK